MHAGGSGGWYRNIAFVPSYNDLGKSETELAGATTTEMAPYGTWWADWASTSNQWIQGGSEEGGDGAAHDYSVLHVKPEQGDKSLEETVGAALEVDFSAPSATEVSSMGAWGYPAAPPYNGLKMFKCVDRPGRLSLSPSLPTMYRIGCTMTGGSSGGGWFRWWTARPSWSRTPRSARSTTPGWRTAAGSGGRGDVPEHEPDLRRSVTPRVP